MDLLKRRVHVSEFNSLCNEDPLWYVDYDDNRRLPRDVDDLCALIEVAHKEECAWASEMIAAVQKFHARSVDLSRLFLDRNSMCMQLLSDDLQVHRLRVTFIDNYYPIALVFPTAWCVHPMRGSSIVFKIERF